MSGGAEPARRCPAIPSGGDPLPVGPLPGCLHSDGMSTTITIRDVSDEVRDQLAASARDRGQSLQAFLSGVLLREAGFRANRTLLDGIEASLEDDGDRRDTPDIVMTLAEERAVRDDRHGTDA